MRTHCAASSLTSNLVGIRPKDYLPNDSILAPSAPVIRWQRVPGLCLMPIMFKCPNCGALYQVLKTEAGSETIDSEPNCAICGEPLPARGGKFVFKYFLLRKAISRQKRPLTRVVPECAPVALPSDHPITN